MNYIDDAEYQKEHAKEPPMESPYYIQNNHNDVSLIKYRANLWRDPLRTTSIISMTTPITMTLELTLTFLLTILIITVGTTTPIKGIILSTKKGKPSTQIILMVTPTIKTTPTTIAITQITPTITTISMARVAIPSIITIHKHKITLQETIPSTKDILQPLLRLPHPLLSL